MPNYGQALFVTAWEVTQVRALCPYLVFHSNHGLSCACGARAWVADANRTLGLREAFPEQSMLAFSFRAAAQYLHHWCKFRKAGFLCTSQCHLLMTCKREGAVLIIIMFSSKNGKNKVVVKRECKHSRTTRSLQKVPIVASAFHVMPRQRLYSDDFGHIPKFA